MGKVRDNRGIKELAGQGILLTVAFVVCFGRFVLGYSRKLVASDYNIPEGGLLLLGLAAFAASPYMAGKVRGLV